MPKYGLQSGERFRGVQPLEPHGTMTSRDVARPRGFVDRVIFKACLQ
jgi:hypothetical protein